jgi:hypothetical protein
MNDAFYVSVTGTLLNTGISNISDVSERSFVSGRCRSVNSCQQILGFFEVIVGSKRQFSTQGPQVYSNISLLAGFPGKVRIGQVGRFRTSDSIVQDMLIDYCIQVCKLSDALKRTKLRIICPDAS